MSRPLTAAEAAAALGRGRQIEQFLDLSSGVLTYLTVVPVDSGFRVSRHVVHDEGDEDFRDITEFSPLDDTQPAGEGAPVDLGRTPDAAITAAQKHGGRPDRWVNAGMAADDYWQARSIT